MATVTGYAKEKIDQLLAAKANMNHSHAGGDVTGGQPTVDGIGFTGSGVLIRASDSNTLDVAAKDITLDSDTGWSNGGITSATSPTMMSNYTTIPGASGWGLKVKHGRVILGFRFDYGGPAQTASATTANIVDVDLGSINDAALHPEFDIYLPLFLPGASAWWARVSAGGTITLTASPWPNQPLATGTQLQAHAEWALK